MKSKAPLVMMEQIIMVLVFALASALCLQLFVLAGTVSNRTEAENRAVAEVQNVAETMKADGLNGYLENYGAIQSAEGWKNFYDGEWNHVTEESKAEYCMVVSLLEEPYIWHAKIQLVRVDGKELARITVAGQSEVMQHE